MVANLLTRLTNMHSWLAILTGIDLSTLPAGADLRLVWTNAPQSWHVFLVIGGVAALVLFVVQLYRYEIGRRSRGIRWVLAGLRITVVMMLAAIYLGPALTFTHQRVLHPVVVLLRDKSQSMLQRDVYPDDALAEPAAEVAGMEAAQYRQAPPTRSELLQMAWNRREGRALERLEQRGRLRVMDFAGEVELVETRAARTADNAPGGELPLEALPEVIADGQATDVYQALTEALAQRLVSAVVLATDGQHTNRDRSRDALVALAQQAGNQGVPILVVGAGDPNRPRNLEVSEVFADAQAWKDEPFEIQTVLRAQGFAGATVQLELVERVLATDGDNASVERVVETRQRKLTAGMVQQRESFTHVVNTVGRFGYYVRAVPLAGELTTEDNQPPAPVEVKVIDEQARVLLVAGTPTWEYRAVRQLLDREKSVNLSCWLQSLDTDRAQEGNTVIQELPHTEAELFQYDVVLLFDPNPQEFDEAWVELLKQFVDEHAGGCFYMAGPLYAGELLSLPRTAGMQDVLPVRLGDVNAMEVASLLESNQQQWPLAVVASNLDQPLMRMFSDRSKTADIWRQFPGIYWSFPVGNATPTARVLIEHSDPALRRFRGARPLLVTGNYGAGRTVFMGFNGSWRWRELGENAEYFNRFWLQTTRYLIEGRSVEGKRRGMIETDQFRYEVGDRIGMTAVLKNEQFEPLAAEQVTATLRISGQEDQKLVLRAVPNQPGRYVGTVVARNSGRHILAVELDPGSQDQPQIETTWTVTLPTIETEQTWLNKPLLRELADASGGNYFALHELDDLAEAVPERKQTMATVGRPIPLWDNSRVLWILVLLLGCEWAVRKRFRLL